MLEQLAETHLIWLSRRTYGVPEKERGAPRGNNEQL
jgi:hypothetical protein